MGRRCFVIGPPGFYGGLYGETNYGLPPLPKELRVLAFALAEKIASTPSVADQLAKFELEKGNPTPAVFTYDDVEAAIPENCETPAVIIHEVGGGNFSTRGEDGAKTTARVQVWGNDDRQSVLRLTWEIWKILNKDAQGAGWNVADAEIFGVLCDPPRIVADRDGFPGYQFDVNGMVFIP